MSFLMSLAGIERYPCYCYMGDGYNPLCIYCNNVACDYCSVDNETGMCCKTCLKVDITPYPTREEAWKNDIGVYYYDAYRARWPERFE